MTQIYMQPESGARCACGDCSAEFEAEELEPVSDFPDRVSPGEIAPAGQCPDCGALAHYVTAPDWSIEARVDKITAELAEAKAHIARLESKLREGVAYQAEQFDGPADEDLSVSGADLVDWFSSWRLEARATLESPARIAVTSPTVLDALKALMAEVEAMTARTGWSGNGAREAAKRALDLAEGRAAITVYVVEGKHFSDPGNPMTVHLSEEAASREAAALVNVMLDDAELDRIAATATEAERNEALALIREERDEDESACDVWITKLEIK